jgi:hypothetical protein
VCCVCLRVRVYVFVCVSVAAAIATKASVRKLERQATGAADWHCTSNKITTRKHKQKRNHDKPHQTNGGRPPPLPMPCGQPRTEGLVGCASTRQRHETITYLRRIVWALDVGSGVVGGAPLVGNSLLRPRR